jgi:hypothetical protein
VAISRLKSGKAIALPKASSNPQQPFCFARLARSYWIARFNGPVTADHVVKSPLLTGRGLAPSGKIPVNLPAGKKQQEGQGREPQGRAAAMP